MCSNFAHTLYYLYSWNCKDVLKNIFPNYSLCGENFVTLQFKALNSENDQKIGRKYNGNIAGDF